MRPRRTGVAGAVVGALALVGCTAASEPPPGDERTAGATGDDPGGQAGTPAPGRNGTGRDGDSQPDATPSTVSTPGAAGATTTPGDDSDASPDGAADGGADRGGVDGDADTAAEVAVILERLLDREHDVRRAIAARVADGRALGDPAALAAAFEDTRTPRAARREATLLTDLGAEEFGLLTARGVVAPTVIDVEVERARTGCVIVVTQLNVLPTYNDEGRVEVRYRLVTGPGNPSGWLVDDVAVGTVPDC